MMSLFQTISIALLLARWITASEMIPPVSWLKATSIARASNGFSVAVSPKVIYIDREFASKRDQNGLTLIPPSAYEFTVTFRQELEQLTSCQWALKLVSKDEQEVDGIYLTGIHNSTLTYEDGEASEEGYDLVISNNGVRINGSGARGMWWGTRTLLQLFGSYGNSSLPLGRIVDAPAYRTRGFMLDAGRKWYSPDFLKELCSYASFFKMSEFHYHASDNYPLSRGRNETWQNVYSQFSLFPESPGLQGIIERPNETLSRQEFEDFQSHCAQRGVTVVPEIEAPGHCLAITKWKPELALAKKDLLNLSHPEAIPTVKSLWADFLPWFQTKEVHIGADEYDATLANDYIGFVNDMATFVKATSGKRIRIWGTNEPSKNLTISEDVIIQHWQYGESEPVLLEKEGYDVINSEDWWAYVTLKNDHTPIFPAPYPQFFNTSRIFNFGNVPGKQWEPSLVNPVNASMQLPITSKRLKGAIMAAWNDNGPAATTQLEAYYAIRKGIPAVAARAWSGPNGVRLDPASLDASVDRLATLAPGQNLDRRLAAPFCWTRANDATTTTILGHGSIGPNHTLSLIATGPFTLSSRDASLSLDATGALVYTLDGWRYPLRSVAETDGFDPGHPGRIWVNATGSTHVPVVVPVRARIEIRVGEVGGSRVWVNGTFAGRFEVFVYGGRNAQFSWSQMAVVAPVDVVRGGVEMLEVR